METFYIFTKSLLDPVVPVVVLLAAGTLAALSRRKKGAMWLLGSALILLYVFSISPVANGLCYMLEKDYVPENNMEIGKLDVIVVLGGGIVENEFVLEPLPSQATSARILHAVQIYRRSDAGLMLCAGKGTGRQSEAEVMGKAAERLGVPKERIVMDSASRNTKEHAIEASRMLRDKNVRVGIVTSAIHMKRSEREFRKYFENVVPLASDFLYSVSKTPLIFSFIPNSGSLMKSAMAWHEMIGYAWYRIQSA